MTKKETRKKYQPPLVDLLECRVERGFIGSLEGFTYGNSYNYDPSPLSTPGGQAEGFSNGNSYGGAMFT